MRSSGGGSTSAGGSGSTTPKGHLLPDRQTQPGLRPLAVDLHMPLPGPAPWPGSATPPPAAGPERRRGGPRPPPARRRGRTAGCRPHSRPLSPAPPAAGRATHQAMRGAFHDCGESSRNRFLEKSAQRCGATSRSASGLQIRACNSWRTLFAHTGHLPNPRGVVDNEPGPIVPAAEPCSVPGDDKPRVLAIDDDPDALAAMETLLGRRRLRRPRHPRPAQGAHRPAERRLPTGAHRPLPGRRLTRLRDCGDGRRAAPAGAGDLGDRPAQLRERARVRCAPGSARSWSSRSTASV